MIVHSRHALSSNFPLVNFPHFPLSREGGGGGRQVCSKPRNSNCCVVFQSLSDSSVSSSLHQQQFSISSFSSTKTKSAAAATEQCQDGDVFLSSRILKSVTANCAAEANTASGGSPSSYAEVAVECESEAKWKRLKGYRVREVESDEELWAAAWIRAETYCEERPYVRYIESWKKKFAEQEFDAMKRRRRGRYVHSVKCICFVAVRVQSSQNGTLSSAEKATVSQLLVGNLDLSLRLLAHGEALLGKSMWANMPRGRGSQLYGYIANVCVAKAARRNGIATSLLGTAIKAARDWGLRELFVHVSSNNKGARDLYDKFNFQCMQDGSEELGVQNLCLLRLLL